MEPCVPPFLVAEATRTTTAAYCVFPHPPQWLICHCTTFPRSTACSFFVWQLYAKAMPSRSPVGTMPWRTWHGTKGAQKRRKRYKFGIYSVSPYSVSLTDPVYRLLIPPTPESAKLSITRKVQLKASPPRDLRAVRLGDKPMHDTGRIYGGCTTGSLGSSPR